MRVESQGFPSPEETLHGALSYFKNLICQSAHSFLYEGELSFHLSHKCQNYLISGTSHGTLMPTRALVSLLNQIFFVMVLLMPNQCYPCLIILMYRNN